MALDHKCRFSFVQNAATGPGEKAAQVSIQFIVFSLFISAFYLLSNEFSGLTEVLLIYNYYYYYTHYY